MWRPPVCSTSVVKSALEKNKAEKGNGGGWSANWRRGGYKFRKE